MHTAGALLPSCRTLQCSTLAQCSTALIVVISHALLLRIGSETPLAVQGIDSTIIYAAAGGVGALLAGLALLLYSRRRSRLVPSKEVLPEGADCAGGEASELAAEKDVSRLSGNTVVPVSASDTLPPVTPPRLPPPKLHQMKTVSL